MKRFRADCRQRPAAASRGVALPRSFVEESDRALTHNTAEWPRSGARRRRRPPACPRRAGRPEAAAQHAEVEPDGHVSSVLDEPEHRAGTRWRAHTKSKVSAHRARRRSWHIRSAVGSDADIRSTLRQRSRGAAPAAARASDTTPVGRQPYPARPRASRHGGRGGGEARWCRRSRKRPLAGGRETLSCAGPLPRAPENDSTNAFEAVDGHQRLGLKAVEATFRTPRFGPDSVPQQGEPTSAHVQMIIPTWVARSPR